MKTILRIFIDLTDSSTFSFKINRIKIMLSILVSINCSISVFGQFSTLIVPDYSGFSSFEQRQIDFDDLLTGYFTAYVYFSPSSGGEFWVYQTVDGGVTWNEKSRFYTGPSCINRLLYAVNTDTCFIDFWTDYSDHFKRSSNSGMTWYSYFNSIDIEPRNITSLNNNVLFMTAKHWGLPNGPFSYLYRIEGDSLYEVYSTREDSLELLKPLFISPDTGFIISHDPSFNDYAILRTYNAGLSWQTCFLNDSLIITDIGFFTRTTGIISCSNGSLYKTIDTGTNWELIKLENSNTINSLGIIDENIGYCGGNSGSFYKTVNQGQSWDVVTFPNTGNIIRLHMIKENFGYISTSAGVFYRYSDVLGIEERLSALNIFPNPANDIINIVFPELMEGPYEVNLVNALGILIYSNTNSGNRFSIDMTSYATGIYFLIVKQGTAQLVKKIVRK